MCVCALSRCNEVIRLSRQLQIARRWRKLIITSPIFSNKCVWFFFCRNLWPVLHFMFRTSKISDLGFQYSFQPDLLIVLCLIRSAHYLQSLVVNLSLKYPAFVYGPGCLGNEPIWKASKILDNNVPIYCFLFVPLI